MEVLSIQKTMIRESREKLLYHEEIQAHLAQERRNMPEITKPLNVAKMNPEFAKFIEL